MLRPKLVIRQRTVAAIVAPLALLLSMGISHQAVAACTAPNNALPSIVTCTGDDNEYETLRNCCKNWHSPRAGQ